MIRISDDSKATIQLRIDAAQRFRDRKVRDPYQKCWARYEGVHYGDPMNPTGRRGLGGDDVMTVNYDYAIVETKVQAIGFNYPDLQVIPQTDDAVDFTDIAGQALRYYWERCGVQDEAKNCLYDRHVCGIAIAYVSWIQEKSKTGYTSTQSDTIGDEADPEDYLVEGGRIPAEGDAAGEDDAIQGEVDLPPIRKWKVIKDQPLVQRIDPLLFWAAPETKNNLNDASYCGFSEWRELSEIRRDPRFKKSAVKKLKGQADSLRGYLSPEQAEKGDEELPDDIKRCRLDHYFEKGRKISVIFCEGEVLYAAKWDWEYEGYPFAILSGIRTPNDFWAQPNMAHWEWQVRSIEQASAIQAANIRAGAVKVVIKGDAPEPHQRKSLSAMAPYTIVHLSERQTLEPLPMPQQTIELESVFDRAERQIQMIAGLGAYESFSPPSKRMTTGEVQQVSGAGSPRALNDRQKFETFCSEILQKMLQLAMQWSTEPLNLPIYDDQQEAITAWRYFDAREICGKFKVSVHVGSTEAPNSADRLQAISYFLQALEPIAQAMPLLDQAGLDVRPIILAAAKSIPGIRNIAQITAPLRQAMQQGALNPQQQQIAGQVLPFMGGAPQGSGGPGAAPGAVPGGQLPTPQGGGYPPSFGGGPPMGSAPLAGGLGPGGDPVITPELLAALMQGGGR